jgi:hypothetical protein
MKTIKLKPGKERSLLRRHPWIFDTAVATGKADGGEGGLLAHVQNSRAGLEF